MIHRTITVPLCNSAVFATLERTTGGVMPTGALIVLLDSACAGYIVALQQLMDYTVSTTFMSCKGKGNLQVVHLL